MFSFLHRGYECNPSLQFAPIRSFLHEPVVLIVYKTDRSSFVFSPIYSRSCYAEDKTLTELSSCLTLPVYRLAKAAPVFNFQKPK